MDSVDDFFHSRCTSSVGGAACRSLCGHRLFPLPALGSGRLAEEGKQVTVSHHRLTVRTSGKGTYEITSAIEKAVRASGIQTGTVTVFVRHTSASLVIYENADPTAREDLDAWMEKIAPEDDPAYTHTLEGPDDTTSHLRMAITRTSEVIPIVAGNLSMGSWQGLFLFEHRRAPHTRSLDLILMGI